MGWDKDGYIPCRSGDKRLISSADGQGEIGTGL